jgi:hypothetical protein
MNSKRLPPLVWVLLIQLILTIFVPPFAWKLRSIFVGDLFFFIWPIPYLFQIWQERREIRKFLLWSLIGSACIFGIVYLHGAFRLSLVDALAKKDLVLTESDQFQVGREGVVTARFLSWLWAGIAVSLYQFSPIDIQRLQRSLIGSALVGSLIMILCKISHSTSVMLGKIYGYDPDAFPWTGRIYGVFRSPNEAGISFGLALMMLLSFKSRSKLLQWLACLGCVVSVALTQSLTSMVSWALILALLAVIKSRGWVRWLIVGCAAAAIVALVPAFFMQGTFLHAKMINFVYRFGPWEVYWKAAFTRWDFLLLGYGWTNYHVDNAYIFLFNRGGLLLLIAFLLWIGRILTRNWHTWTSAQTLMILFVLFSGLTIDSLILRPVVALMVSMTIPLLTRSAREAEV